MAALAASARSTTSAVFSSLAKPLFFSLVAFAGGRACKDVHGWGGWNSWSWLWTGLGSSHGRWRRRRRRRSKLTCLNARRRRCSNVHPQLCQHLGRAVQMIKNEKDCLPPPLSPHVYAYVCAGSRHSFLIASERDIYQLLWRGSIQRPFSSFPQQTLIPPSIPF